MVTVDLNVEKTENCVVVNTKEWVQNPNMLSVHRMSGRDIPTYITKAVHANPNKEVLKGLINNGDLLFLSRVASEVAQYKTYALEDGEPKFYNVPMLQVIGVFENQEVSLESLKLLYNRVLVKKVQPAYNTFIQSTLDTTFVGEVVKLGLGVLDKDWNIQEYRVSMGDHVLIRDNVETEIYFNGKYYYAIEEANIAGILKEAPYSLETMEPISESIIMEEYVPEKVLGTKLLTPSMNYEDADYTEIYNRDLLRVVSVDSKLTNIQRDDILLLDRNITNYVYFNLEKYFIIRGIGFIEAKIEI